MKYALLLYSGQEEWEATSEDEQSAVLQEYVALDEAMKAKGVLAGGEGLEPPSTATVVRVRDGKRQVTDGPFAETKEALGGFYVVDCADLDEAIEWAAKVPDARVGTVEVRPVIDYEALGMAEADTETST